MYHLAGVWVSKTVNIETHNITTTGTGGGWTLIWLAIIGLNVFSDHVQLPFKCNSLFHLYLKLILSIYINQVIP